MFIEAIFMLTTVYFNQTPEILIFPKKMEQPLFFK